MTPKSTEVRHSVRELRSSMLSPACVFVRLFSCTRTAAVVTCSRKSCRTWSPVALSPLIMAARVLSHGMHLVQRRQVTRFNSSRITLTKMGCLNQLHIAVTAILNPAKVAWARGSREIATSPCTHACTRSLRKGIFEIMAVKIAYLE